MNKKNGAFKALSVLLSTIFSLSPAVSGEYVQKSAGNVKENQETTLEESEENVRNQEKNFRKSKKNVTGSKKNSLKTKSGDAFDDIFSEFESSKLSDYVGLILPAAVLSILVAPKLYGTTVVWAYDLIFGRRSNDLFKKICTEIFSENIEFDDNEITWIENNLKKFLERLHRCIIAPQPGSHFSPFDLLKYDKDSLFAKRLSGNLIWIFKIVNNAVAGEKIRNSNYTLKLEYSSDIIHIIDCSQRICTDTTDFGVLLSALPSFKMTYMK